MLEWVHVEVIRFMDDDGNKSGEKVYASKLEEK